MVVGIAMITLFSLHVKPQSSYDNILISNANSFPEAKVYFEQYPNANVTVDRNDVYPVVMYDYERVYDNGSINDARMSILTDHITGLPDRNQIFVDCGYSYVNGFGGMSVDVVGPPVIEVLQTMPCAK